MLRNLGRVFIFLALRHFSEANLNNYTVRYVIHQFCIYLLLGRVIWYLNNFFGAAAWQIRSLGTLLVDVKLIVSSSCDGRRRPADLSRFPPYSTYMIHFTTSRFSFGIAVSVRRQARKCLLIV
jgi:hypothetical protein